MENETKLCKHCKSEIPKGAKVCPNCRKKQGGIGKWIVIVVVVVIIIAAMSGGGADKPKKVENASTQNNTDNKADVVNDTTEDTSVKQEDSEKDIFGIGETAEMNDVQVTMVNYTQSSGSEYNKPADGNEFVLVEFEIANNSDSEINISSMASFEAYADDYALNYSVSALLEKAWKAILQDGSLVAPGTNGTLKFDYTGNPANATSGFHITTTVEHKQTDDGAGYGAKDFGTLTAKSGVTIPDILKALALFPNTDKTGRGFIYFRNNGERLLFRGGSCGNGGNAGGARGDFNSPRSLSHVHVGLFSAYVDPALYA